MELTIPETLKTIKSGQGSETAIAIMRLPSHKTVEERKTHKTIKAVLG